MRIVAVVMAMLVLLAVAGKEFMWRIDHPLVQAASFSPDESQVVEVRSLPEGSAAPYGYGVFVFQSWAALRSAQASLAYAGYCRQIVTSWQTAKQLRIKCLQPEGGPKLLAPKVKGVSVELVAYQRAAPNPSFKRTGLRPAA